MDNTHTTILVIMGVCGCGKSTVAEGLQSKLTWPMADADGFHSDANKTKMAAGIPLTDEDRTGWLLTLHEVIKGWCQDQQNGIITCSALKKKYRDILLYGADAEPSSTPEATMPRVITFVYLKGSKETLEKRLSERIDHFMPGSLLQSQLETLEEPSAEERHVTVDCSQSVKEIVDSVMTALNLK